VVVVELDDGVICIGSVLGIGLLVGSSPAHFLFVPTVILVAAGVVLIINTQSDTADKSSIRGSSNERNLIVKSTAKFNFARLICLLIRGGSSSSLLIAVFDGGVSPGATAPTLSTQIITDFRFVVVWSILPPIILSIAV
jgi:hypothetical protein